MKGKRLYIALAVVLRAVVGGAFGLLFEQPLLPSTAYVATATLNGAPTRAELFRPAAMSNLYYVHFPDATPTNYCWLGIAFSGQTVLSLPMASSFPTPAYPSLCTVGGRCA